MQRIRQALAACVPFVAILAVFAAAVAWHLGEPQRQLDRFGRLATADGPTARDYGDDARVVLTRRGCAQQCSAYTVSITGAGVVDFVGRAGACVTAPVTDQVPRAAAQRLVDAMVRAGFDALPTTGPMARRGPGEQSAVVILELDGRRRAVDDRVLPERPLLAAIEQRIDRVAGTARWMPRDGDSAPAQSGSCPGPGSGSQVVDGDGPRLAARDPAPLLRQAPALARRPDAARALSDVLAGRTALAADFPDSAWVSLRRTACYGTCPVYTVRVSGGGEVDFQGEQFTCATRVPTRHIPREAAQRLLNALAAVGFTALPDFVREDMTDHASAIMTFSDGRAPTPLQHTVRHYRGMVDVPAQVGALEEAIDAAAGTRRWLPARAGGESACTAPPRAGVAASPA